MWFVEHLLLFSAAYALWRALRRRQAEPDEHGRKAPHYLSIVAFALGLAVVSAVVRIWYPIDKWVFLLGFFRVAFADLPRDLAFFVIGLVAYRRQWLSTFPTRTGRVWLSVGLVLAGLWYAYALGLNALFPIGETAMGVIYPIWEALLCCGMCIGLVVLFRDRLDVQGRLGRALGQSQYAAYIFHVPVILLFQYAVLGLDFPPFAKFALVTLLSVPLTFLLSNWVRRPLQL
jgi:multidrug transporter EmrE-like cation transporter